MDRIKSDSWILNRPVAHRGLHNIEEGIPENSMGAFQAAVAAGHPIELDVHLTTDGRIFILHDFNTQRVCGRDFNVSGMRSDMLKDFRLMGTEFTLPLLDDVLAEVKGQVPILIEIKSESVHVGPLEEKLHETFKKDKGEVAIESFNPLSIRYMRKKDPEYIIGQLSYDFKGKDNIPGPVRKLLENCRLNFLSHPDFIAYDIKNMPRPFLKTLEDGSKTALLGWTIRTQEDRSFAESHCDNYIFEKLR